MLDFCVEAERAVIDEAMASFALSDIPGINALFHGIHYNYESRRQTITVR